MGYRRGVGDIFRALLLLALFSLWMVPTFIMIGNSFSADKSFSRSPPSILPARFSLENYQDLLSLKMLPRWILNTLLVLVCQVVGIILINGMAAYVFVFYKRLKWLFWLFMAPIFVSFYVLLVPQFVIFGKLGMIGLPAVALPGLWSTGIFLFRNYFRSIPISLTESARMDGAGEMYIFRRIILPLSKPLVASAVVLLSMGVIGSYVWPMLNLRAIETQTYLVGLMNSAINVYAIKNVGRDLAIGVMAMLPYLAIYSFSSKSFTQGIAGAAVKE